MTPATLEDEPKTAGTPAADPTPADGGTAGDDGASATPADPLTAGLEEGLEAAKEFAQPQPDAPVDASKPPAGLTVDEKGRWRTADGKFAAKQPSEAAAKSAKEETDRMARIADYKAKGMDEHGNKPWTPNIYGQEKPIVPGAVYRDGHGLFIPQKSLAHTTMLLARGERLPEVSRRVESLQGEVQKAGERSAFAEEQFKQILEGTLLDPEWMDKATKDATSYEVAKLHVQNLLRAAGVTAREKFGALPAPVKPGESAASAPPLDQYEAYGTLTDFLGELSQSPEFQGMTDADRNAVIAQLKKDDLPVFVNHPDHGWLLDERLVTLTARYIQTHKKQVASPAPTAPSADATRNKAAVPASPAKPVAPQPAAARRAPQAPPDDPRNDPRYADRPWDNPALSREERRELFYKRNLGIRAPG